VGIVIMPLMFCVGLNTDRQPRWDGITQEQKNNKLAQFKNKNYTFEMSNNYIHQVLVLNIS